MNSNIANNLKTMETAIAAMREEIRTSVLGENVSETIPTGYRLCFLTGHNGVYDVWFTSGDPKDMWGDGWRSSSALESASPPSEPRLRHSSGEVFLTEEWNEDGSPKWNFIRVVALVYPLEEPMERYSVQRIMDGIPWIVLEEDKRRAVIRNEMTLSEFISEVENVGGTVMVPRRGWAASAFPKSRPDLKMYPLEKPTESK